MSGTPDDFFASFGRSGDLKATHRAREKLEGVEWAQPLLNKLDSGGPEHTQRSLRFELRFAAALHRADLTADYEYLTGVGGSSVDFKIDATPQWLIEIVSIEMSDAARRACRKEGELYSFRLSSRSVDARSTEQGEMVRVCEKIAAKAKKFPKPSPGVRHMILADMRGYLLKGGDRTDYMQIAYGPGPVQPELVQFWNNKPVRGLFEFENPLRSAAVVQDRVHCLGFLVERDYIEDELRDAGCCFYLPNPLLLPDEEAKRAFLAYPLRPLRPSESASS